MENQNESHTFSTFSYDIKHRYLTSNAKDRDYFSILPVEIIVKILRFLSIPELRTCAVVSKYWNTLSSCAPLWINICLKGISIKIQLLERILNSNVKKILLHAVKIIEAENVVPPFFKTSRFDSLQEILVWSFIKLEVLSELLSLSPNLRHLELRFYKADLGSNFFRQIVKLQFLERLHLCKPRVKDVPEIIQIIQSAEKFETLKNIYFILHFNDKRQSKQFYESFLGRCPNLEFLAIPEQHINESGFNHILRMKDLKNLDIENVILPSNLSHIKKPEKWINLQEINICGIGNPASVLTFLLLCPNLEALSVDGVITYSIFEQILTYKKLKKLQFTDFDLTVLKSVKSFKTINELRILELFNFNSSVLPEVEACVLSKLVIKCENLIELILGRPIIDDNLFRQLSQMDNLEKLEVESPTFHSKFNADGNLENYRKFKRLKYLFLEFGGSEHSVCCAEVILGCCKNLIDLTVNVASEKIWNCIYSMSDLVKLMMINLKPDESILVLNNIDTFPKLSQFNYVYVSYLKLNSNLHQVEALLSLCGNMEDIYFSKINLTDSICRSISTLKDLQHLYLLFVAGISNDKIEVILNGCPGLARDKIGIFNKASNDDSKESDF